VADGLILKRSTGTVTFPAEPYRGQITLTDPQFLAGGELQPIITGPDGTLVGELASDGGRLWILSDPDLLSNQGIGKADNAAVAVALIDRLRRGGVVIVDETVHGFELHANLFRLALHPPFVIVTIGAAAALLLLFWAGTGRFGAAQAVPPALAAGKATLIDNAAGLLRLGGAMNPMPARYLRVLAAAAIGKLNGPAGLDEAAGLAWLDRFAASHGRVRRLAPLRARAARLAAQRRSDPRRAQALAMALYRWQQEMVHGTGRGPVDR